MPTDSPDEIERWLAEGPLSCWEHPNKDAPENHLGICPHRHIKATAAFMREREVERDGVWLKERAAAAVRDKENEFGNTALRQGASELIAERNALRRELADMGVIVATLRAEIEDRTKQLAKLEEP